ncbi:hypothetical protein B0H17DRAFT_1062850, partial [Mycena rosella]
MSESSPSAICAELRRTKRVAVGGVILLFFPPSASAVNAESSATGQSLSNFSSRGAVRARGGRASATRAGCVGPKPPTQRVRLPMNMSEPRRRDVRAVLRCTTSPRRARHGGAIPRTSRVLVEIWRLAGGEGKRTLAVYD